jgi:O-antigen/teichoic acid export membrane protein
MGWSYWSLTAGVGVGRLVRGLLLHYWRPVSFARPHWADLGKPLRFGSQVALSRLAWSTYTLSDGIVVGRVLGDSVLGVYRMALNLAAAPAFKVSQLLMGTAAPLFAKVQADLPLMRRYYLIMVEILMLTLLPLMLGLTMVAPEAIPAVLGRQWLNAIVPLQWLAVFMTLRILGILHEQVLISQGLSGFSMRLSMLSLVILPAAFWAAATWFGSSGVAAAWIFLAPVTILPLIIRVLVAIRLPVMDLLRAMLPAAAGCVPMVAALFFLRDWLADRSYAPAAALAVETVGGGAVYLAVLFTGFRPRIMRYLNFLRDVRRDAALPASATATE